MSMKNKMKRLLALLLAATILASLCSVTAFAKTTVTGSNGKDIYLGWKYYTDKDCTAVTESLTSGETYYAKLFFYNNPVNSVAESIGGFDLTFSAERINITLNDILFKKADTETTPNFKNNEIGLHWASAYGITNDDNELLTNGVLVTIKFSPKENVSGSNLYTLLPLIQQSASGVFSKMTAGASTAEETIGFNIVELPHLAVTVNEGAEFYDTSTPDEIKAGLSVSYIDPTGYSAPLAGEDVIVTLPTDGLKVGENTITVTGNGHTSEVTINVVEDEVTGIKVTHDPDKMSYSSGQTLKLDGIVVKAVHKSGKETDINVEDLFTRPANGAKLRTANSGAEITVMYGSMQGNTAGILTVNKADLKDAQIADIEDIQYQYGAEIKPTPEITLNGDTLVNGTDYDLTYVDNTNVGTATLTATGKGTEYTGSKDKSFQITQATGELTLKVNNQEGNAVTVTYGDALTFTGNGAVINADTASETKIQYKTETGTYEDFTYGTVLDAGKYYFKAIRLDTPNVAATDSNEVEVTINQKNIADSDVTINVGGHVYDGNAAAPEINITFKGTRLQSPRDYTLSGYEGFKNVTDNASVTITGTGNNYTGSVTRSYKITPQWLSVTASNFLQLKDGVESVTYTGLPITPKVDDSITVGTNNPIMLTKDVDYTVEYESNINAGTAKITIKSKTGSNYTFDKFTVDFTINPVKIKINSSQYDWVPYVDGDKIKGYDSDGGGQQSPYFDYDGYPHGIKLQFKDDARVNGIKLETLVRITYTSETTRTNAGGYATQMKFELKEDCKTNYQLLNGNDEVVQERPLSKTWSIHKATLQVTAPDLNIRCLELAGEKPVDYTYSLDWLGTGVKPNNLKITLKGLNCTGNPSYDNATNTITFPQVTAKAADTPTDSVELELGFTNYKSIKVTIPVKYINKLSVSDKLSMADIEVVYGESYAPVLKLDSTTVTPKTLTYTDENGNTVANPKNAGTYTIKATYEDDTEETVEGVTYPGHIGEKTATLTIKKRPLTADVKHAAITYGEAVDVNDCTVTFGNLVPGESLTKGTDFTVSTSYKTGDDVGDEYGFFINLQGVAANNYTVPTVTGTLTVNPKPLTAAMVEDVTAGLTYNGNEQKPTVTVKDDEKTLTSGTDYTLTYKNNTNAGTATVTVEGKGNYTGKVEKDFSIAKATPTLALVDAEGMTYTGERYSNSNVKVTNPSNVNVTYHYYKDADCKQTADPIDAGTYYVKISFAGDGNYNAVTPGTVKSFTISRANHPISIAAASVTYTGAPYSETNITVTPTCEVTFTYYASETGNEPITRPTDVGTYWVVASYAGTDNYNSSTSARVSFSITKATPPTPAEVKVDGEDKTLKDLEDSMRKDLGNIEGKFTWRDSDGKELPSDTKIEANKEYEWTFTPTGKDAKNYRPIYGKTTPYVRDDLSWLPGVLGGGSTFNFRDVTRYDYFYNAVKWAAENGIASGTSRYTFSPDAVCTRAQTVTFLWRAAGSPMPSYRISPFTDVNYGDYYYNAVLWAVEQGITTGLTATTFGPDKTVTRGQVAMFLYRAASAVKPNITNSFTDVKSTAYNYDAILWAYDNRITTGTSTTTFSPDAFCTRAQIVTFLYRFYQGR